MRLALAVLLCAACGSPAAKPSDPTKPATRAAVERCTTGKEAPAKEDALADKTIARICVEGGSKETKKKIDDAFALHAGSVFAADTLRSDLESAYGTNLVDDIRASTYEAEGGKLLLVVQIHERPKIASLTIEGAKANSNAELVKAFPVKSGDTYDPAKLHANVVQLRDGYHAAGYKHAKIEREVEPTNDERVNVKLTIKEE